MLVLLIGGIMNYAVEMVLGVMICIPSFMRICYGNKRLIGGIHTQTGK
jgi:hypothetical protein